MQQAWIEDDAHLRKMGSFGEKVDCLPAKAEHEIVAGSAASFHG